MKIPFTADQQEAFLRHAIEARVFQSAEDALEQALALWEERDGTRAALSPSAGDRRPSHYLGKVTGSWRRFQGPGRRG